MNLFISNNQINVIIPQELNYLFELSFSKGFTQPIIEPVEHYTLTYHNNYNCELNSFSEKFEGRTTDVYNNPYNWEIFNLESSCQNGTETHSTKIGIQINYLDNGTFEKVTAIIIPDEKKIDVFLKIKNYPSKLLDPLFHPLGSLIMVYMAFFSDAFMIHASGVVFNNNGYIFPAVSGTGKSTMANLWLKHGAELINDDRLWIQKINNKWRMFSTPMPSYIQPPKMWDIKSIFLIRQSPTNILEPLSGLKASMQVMSNCIQHFYNQEMTTAHLDKVLNFCSKTAIFDCGFEPNTKIIDQICQLP